jgi:hypothetical protein
MAAILLSDTVRKTIGGKIAKKKRKMANSLKIVDHRNIFIMVTPTILYAVCIL